MTGLLVPGSVPLFVTAIMIRRRHPTITQTVGLVLITSGAILCLVTTPAGASLLGAALLLLAGLAWATYTVGLQRTRLRLIDLIVLVNCASAAGALVVLLLGGSARSSLLTGAATLDEVTMFALTQGLGTGILSTLAYATAVRHLGSPTASVGGALSPVATALIAVPLLGEAVTPALALPLVLIVVGVVAFNARWRINTSRTTPREGRPMAALAEAPS